METAWLLVLWCLLGAASGQVAEYEMLSKVLAKYPKELCEDNGRPVMSYSDKVSLGFELLPLSLNQLNEMRQTISILATLKLRWRDPYLAWKDLDNGTYNYIAAVSIDNMLAWTPTVLHSNNVEQPNTVDDFGTNSNLFVDSDGRVTWEPTGIYTAWCELELSNFPFDHQTCSLVFEPWPSYSAASAPDGIELAEVGMTALPSEFLLPGSIWSVKDFTYEQQGNQAIYRVQLRRNFEYTLYNVIVPCSLLSILQLAAFGIRADANERPAYSVSVLLTFAIYHVMTKADIPETPQIVYLGLYVVIQFGIGTVAAIHSAVLCYFLTRHDMKLKDNAKKQGSPEVARYILPAKYVLVDRLVFVALFIASVLSHGYFARITGTI